jgi:hypothetical protein
MSDQESIFSIYFLFLFLLPLILFLIHQQIKRGDYE